MLQFHTPFQVREEFILFTAGKTEFDGDAVVGGRVRWMHCGDYGMLPKARSVAVPAIYPLGGYTEKREAVVLWNHQA